MNDLIGFFDSGVGGVSVLHEAVKLLPNEHFLFYGDNLHAPYGPRPLEEIRALSAAGIDVLLSRGVKAIVIACNTATSAYAEIVRAAHPELPIVGMEPALKPAHFARHGGKVIVLATDATLRLEKFERLMRLYGDDVITVVGHGLVELVESGKAHAPEATFQLEALLGPYMEMQIDAIVLGCTHFPFLCEPIRRLFPQSEIFDGREGTAKRLMDLLNKNGLRSDDTPGSVEYQSSAGPEAVALMRRLMDELG
ncbi:MAG: glutamate racemase [Oscillospiraceae bacterium]|nr:glutamate racemase [Oscillospiraceae bacterium]